MTESASSIHPDVLQLAQKISDKVEELADAVETLDANNWLNITDEILKLNEQLQSLLVETPTKTTKKGS